MTDRLTQQLAEILRDCSPEPVETETYELLRLGDDRIILDEETVAVLGVPVYVGKVPIPAIKALKNINANGAVAVAAVSYGARTYGNALYELQHFAEDGGSVLWEQELFRSDITDAFAAAEQDPGMCMMERMRPEAQCIPEMSGR